MEKHYTKNMGEITYVYGVNLEEHKKVIEKQQKRIAELEQELAKEQKHISRLKNMNKSHDETVGRLTEENNQLKQQLAEKDKEIESLSRKVNRYENMFRSRAIKRTGDMQKDIEIYMNNIAIQQLRQVQEECFTQKELISTGQVAFFMVDIVDIMEIISQHIKELERV